MVSFGEGVFMKTSFAVVAVVAFGLAGNEAAKGSGNTSSNSGGAAPHHGSAPAPATTTTVTPRFSGGVPHYSGAMPYRPTVNYGNGNRTLNYPPVGNSVLGHQIHSGANSLNTGYALQRSGNLHQAGNLRQPSALNAMAKKKLDPQTS